MNVLHLDIETFSSVDLKTEGVYKYAASPDFEVLMVAYAYGKDPVKCYAFKDLPDVFFKMYEHPEVIKVAHNAAFERVCFEAIGHGRPIEEWRCSAVKAAYCGLPMGLAAITKALELGEKGKLSTGSALIRYFCMPVKATATNGGRTRNTPDDNAEKWDQFKTYCINDVEAEREIMALLAGYKIPESEVLAYQLDQRINDRGVSIDLDMAESAILADTVNTEILKRRIKEITGLSNPNSLAQLKAWLGDLTGLKIQSLTKDSTEALLKETSSQIVREVLQIRQKTGKTSIKKYDAMKACRGEDGRARGLFQFYGAGRTGRWSGRLIQLQNLPRNYIKDLDTARELLKALSPEDFALCFDVSDTLSQLIRTAIIPSKGKRFAVADYSAIEARVIAWLAGEEWRLEVFATHGKIYEASASKMFNVPLESIGKGSDLRQKGKVAELALGYQGSTGALKTMGGEKMGLSEADMDLIVNKWRAANQKITKLWYSYNDMALDAVRYRKTIKHPSGVTFSANSQSMQIELPSGRKLIYWNAQLSTNRFGKESIRYKGVDTLTKQWTWIDTYGGKLTENIVQAVSRDLLLYSMQKISAEGFDIVMHVHDEVVAEVVTTKEYDKLLELMAEAPDWAKGLPLSADGYTCAFYKKD